MATGSRNGCQMGGLWELPSPWRGLFMKMTRSFSDVGDRRQGSA
jgi:hypothetical protein